MRAAQRVSDLEFIAQAAAANGSVMQRLKANGFNLERALRTNRILTDEQWRVIDLVVKQAAQPRLPIASRFAEKGMIDPLEDWSVLESEYQKEFDMSAADRSMSGRARGTSDMPESIPVITPVPIHFKDFSFEARMLASSRRRGQGINRASARLAGRKVAISIEDMIINGISTINLAGRTVLGLLTEPNRNTYTIPVAWDGAVTGNDILDDVLAMIQVCVNDFMFGPYDLYVCTAYDTVLNDDFKAESSQTIRQRLEAISSIERVIVADRMPDDTVALVQTDSDVADIAVGQQITNLEWDDAGGLVQNMKTMAALTAQIKSTAEGQSGICHGSV